MRNRPTPSAPELLQAGQVGHQARVHVQLDGGAAERLRRLVAEAGIALLRLGLHRHLVAEGVDDAVLGAQVDDALVAVDQDLVAVQRLGGDAARVEHQRDRPGAGDDRGVAADRPLFQHHAPQAAAVFQKFARADVARDEDRVVGQFGAGVASPGR